MSVIDKEGLEAKLKERFGDTPAPPTAQPAQQTSQPKKPPRQQPTQPRPAPERPASGGEALGEAPPAPEPAGPPPPAQPATAESATVKSLEQMLADLDKEAAERKTAFDAEISSLAVRMSHHEVVDEARINERRRVLELAVLRRDQMMGVASGTSSAPDPSGNGDDQPPTDGGGDDASTDETQVIDLTQMPTTAEELKAFIGAQVAPLAKRVDKVEDYLSSRHLRKYKPEQKPAQG